MNKIKVAFVKFAGLANAGTEKYLQTLAAGLPKDEFDVTYFYCDAAPYIGSDWKHPDTDPNRLEWMENTNVKLVKFDVEFKDVTTSTHDWVNTNFWEFFNEDDFDIIQTGRAGHPEYPFTLINKTPIIDSIHLAGMAENKSNTKMTILVSERQREEWISSGGNKEKSISLPGPIIIPDNITESYRDTLNLENKFVFGIHQRNDDGIFSPIILESYKKIESDKTCFIILGGSDRYRKQSKDLGIKNIIFMDTTSDVSEIHKFLGTLDVYAHGRSDGEQCSGAITEALSHGLPVVSHVAPSMGHLDQIDDAGLVVNNVEEYSEEMKKLMTEPEYKQMRSKNAKKRYESVYSVDSIMDEYIKICKKVLK